MSERIFFNFDKIIVVFIFCLFIYTPLFIWMIQEDAVTSAAEKRNLATIPLLPESLKTFSEYPDEFNKYYSDHFGFREIFTQIYFKLLNKLSTRTSVDDVTIGQDGWLFLGSIKKGYARYNDPIGDAMNVNLFTENELKDFAKSIVSIKNWLNKKGIEYVYVIAPNKHTIYFDKLPKYVSKQNNKSSTDQLVEYLRKYTNVEVVDLRQELLNERNKHQVYFKTDTHWNHYGANVAQYEIMKIVHSLFPGQINPFLLNNDQFKKLSTEGGDLALFAKIEDINENNPQPVFETGCNPVNETLNAKSRETHTMVCESQKLNVVIFCDSFFVALHPYISRQFKRSTYIWEKINSTSLAKYVEQESPDIVIEEVVERSFPYIPPKVLF